VSDSPRPRSFYAPLSPPAEGRFESTPAVVGPWDPRLSHGSPPAALLLRTIDRAFPRDDVRVGRIAFDFLGPVTVGEVTLSAEMVRPGARVELARARLAVGGRTAMEATAWRISATPGRVPEVRDPRPVPPLPSEPARQLFVDVPRFGYGEALEWRFVEGGFDRTGPAAVYARPLTPLFEGEEISPLGRLLLMVDSANGISAELPPSRFTFVPVELTVSVLRHPRTEWVGMSARTTLDGDGVGHTHAELFDQEGYLGTALQTLFVAPAPAK
jgi:hypothetical protein